MISPNSFLSDHEEITFIVFQSVRDPNEDDEGPEMKRAELDIAVHVKYDLGQMVVAIHSPYWMVNKTSRLLQYKADDIHRKHPLDYDMPLLFSFKPRYFLKNNKVKGNLPDNVSRIILQILVAIFYIIGYKIGFINVSAFRLIQSWPFLRLVS